MAATAASSHQPFLPAREPQTTLGKGGREGSYVWLWQRRWRRRRRQRGMNLLHAIRPFVWKRSERASVGRRSKGTTDDEYNQLEVQIGRLRLEVGQEGHLNPENGTNSITERVEMINNDLADIICGDQPVEFTPVARRGLPRGRDGRCPPARRPPPAGWLAARAPDGTIWRDSARRAPFPPSLPPSTAAGSPSSVDWGSPTRCDRARDITKPWPNIPLLWIFSLRYSLSWPPMV